MCFSFGLKGIDQIVFEIELRKVKTLLKMTKIGQIETVLTRFLTKNHIIMISDGLKDFVTVSQSRYMFLNTCDGSELHIRILSKIVSDPLKNQCPGFS